ncbi:MAG: hypothetical protein IJM71_09405 [Clostridia bacterium]|nr:hypothetical protein [Clostridia bacterium]
MKKIVAIILGLIMLLALVACGTNGGGEATGTEPATAAPTAPATDEATESESETEPTEEINLQEKVDAFFEKYMCVTHNKLDIMFNYAGASFTIENLTNIIKEAAGLPESFTVEIDEADFETFLENYQGAGDGGGGTGNGFYWPDPVDVKFSNPATGEEIVKEQISFSFRKCLPSSEIYPNGVLGTCPEDGNMTMQAAYGKLNETAISDDAPAYEGYEGEYTAEAVESFFRELTGLTDKDAYEFYAIGFDPEAKGEPFYALFSDKNAPDGKFDAVWVETAFN